MEHSRGGEEIQVVKIATLSFVEGNGFSQKPSYEANNCQQLPGTCEHSCSK